jgi:DNA-binding beta-propeller fold protein YncE
MKFTLDGKELLAVPGIKAYGIAVDPATGNVWTTRVFGGRIEDGTTIVYSPEGKRLASHPAVGYDIAFDPKNKSMWAVAQEVTRLSLDGKVIARKRVTDYYAVSVAPCPITGNAWVSVNPGGGRAVNDYVVAFDKDMKEVARFSTDGTRCPRLAVSPKDGSVWAALAHREIRRYSKEGKLEATFEVEVTSLAADHATGGIWATTADETLRMTRDGKITARIPHKAKSRQAWVASY